MTNHIKNILSTVVQTKNNWKLQLLGQWKEIIGNLSNKVTIEKIYEDTIVLGVSNSSWMQELYLLSPVLIKTINKNLDRPRIKQVRFKMTGRKKTTIKKTAKKMSRATTTVHLTPREKQALETIPDQTLRAALKAFYIRCARERQCKE